MKKSNKFSKLTMSELLAKQKILVGQYVTYKVSLDTSAITESNNVFGLKKDIKSIQRQIAIVSTSNNTVVGG